MKCLFRRKSSKKKIIDIKRKYFDFQIALSGWLTGHYNFRCQPVDYSNHPKTLRVGVIKRNTALIYGNCIKKIKLINVCTL